DRSWMIDKSTNGLLQRNTVAGSSGGTISGAGVALSWDTRDNIYFPSSGTYHQFQHVVYGHFMGSTFTFQRTLLDLRSFSDLGSGHILALQAQGMISGGTPPFDQYALLGGGDLMRGYYTGRYRDNIFLGAQAEYRKMLFWRLGIAAFAGAGDVAPRWAGFDMRDVKVSCGGGFRFMFDTKEQLTTRLDIGLGRSTSGVYLAIKEAF
ncbi:MAG TPA: BamA/TamA family outer membrane protein, partial [Bacteroidota bacterium]|nr:BamA/TamA family outer membrane protein [Bacteroidota bacterium]